MLQTEMIVGITRNKRHFIVDKWELIDRKIEDNQVTV